MLNRRALFTGSAATAMAAASFSKAMAKEAPFADFDPRGTIGVFERLPSLQVESELEFITGYRAWMVRSLYRQATKRSLELLRLNGIDLTKSGDLDQIVRILTEDHSISMVVHNMERTQEQFWKLVKDECDRNADVLLEEMTEAEKLGPGTLQLNKDLDIPDYACYEIHIQPGGYVGDRFAGHIYFYGTSVVLAGGNQQDQLQMSWVRGVPRPADGKVRRILDQGTSCGQFAHALKDKFPEAEVWGNDVGGPMLRFAHMNSVKLGKEIHYVQELSETTQFPDNHFDIVTSNLLIHEVPAEKITEISAEAYRTLRPGGVYFPLDSYTGGQVRGTALSHYSAWRNYRWNHEVWWMEYYHYDLAQAMRDVGFKVDENGPKARSDTTHNVIGYKV
jgi:ubiquinone/menaquinone biosynthesis C-methylase UbiE